MANTVDAILSDMTLCTPAGAFQREYLPGHWQIVDYETKTGIHGSMIYAYPGDRCPEMTLPLNMTGPYRIYLGINYTKTHDGTFPQYGQLEVKLTSDLAFYRVGAEPLEGPKAGSKMGIRNETYKSIQEAYWKSAELGGENLVFRQPSAPFGEEELSAVTNLSYVRFSPLTGDELEMSKLEQPRQDTRRIAVIYCTGHLTGHAAGTREFHPTSSAWFEQEFVPHINSDVGIFIFEGLRGNYCCYPTRIGHFGIESNVWPAEWLDPMQYYPKIARRYGIKFFCSLRMFGVQFPVNRAPIAWATYYHDHSTLAKRDKQGIPLTGLSLAYPEVRDYWISLLREVCSYDIDGLHIHLNRATPFVYYETPVVESFIKQYDVDPRLLDENDSRWTAHRASYVTEFLREIRGLVDEYPGRELGVTIYGAAHKYDPNPSGFHPIRYLCDVETWIREQLVDYVIPSPMTDLQQLRSWRDLGGGAVHLWPDLMPRGQAAQDYAALARRYYQSGADGVSIWDAERRTPRASEWAAVRSLGHIDLLEHIERLGPTYYSRVPLETLAGFSVDESFHDG